MDTPMPNENPLSVQNHPVWDVHDDYREAMMNARMQQAHIRRLRRWNYWIEIPLALLASSTVAGLWFWSSAVGGVAWKSLGIVTAFLAIMKPILKIPDNIQKRGECLGDATAIENQLEKLVKQINQRRKYDEELRERYLKILDLKAQIRQKWEHLDNSKRIKRACMKEVTELKKKIFVPEEETA